jgi:solute carrier family 24 (sodium/potassium/calcium exchanger), member 6
MFLTHVLWVLVCISFLSFFLDTVWDDICYDGDLHAIQKFLLLCELFFTAMRKLTVPIPCEGYYNRGLVALSLALSPVWLFHYMSDNFGFDIVRNWYIVLLVIGMVTIGAAALMRCAPSGEDANLSIVVATPIALYGFIIAATWIDTIAEALVSLLNFLGIILRIPGPILGLTVLAWGNSMGDLNANMTMARKGLANMAMTACFAGPVFNILVGLGMGFSSLAAITGQATNEVSVSPSIITGFVFIIINCIAMLAVGLTHGRIPKHFGYGALALYFAYVATSIALQYSSKFNGDS